MKTIQEMIAVMQAFADGKEIEWAYQTVGEKEFSDCNDPDWNWLDYDYRIKPEPTKTKIVPYESIEEFLEAQREHGPYITYKTVCLDVEPHVSSSCSIILIDHSTGGCGRSSFSSLFREFTWKDGTACGKEVLE